MSIPTCAVRASISDSVGGKPIAGARVTANLSSFEVYQGFVVPQLSTVVADNNGVAILNLWPNTLGVLGSHYKITITSPNGKTFRTTAVVPNTGSCELMSIIAMPEYEGSPAGDRILTEIAEIRVELEAFRIAFAEVKSYVAVIEQTRQQLLSEISEIHSEMDAFRITFSEIESHASEINQARLQILAEIAVLNPKMIKAGSDSDRSESAAQSAETYAALAGAAAGSAVEIALAPILARLTALENGTVLPPDPGGGDQDVRYAASLVILNRVAATHQSNINQLSN